MQTESEQKQSNIARIGRFYDRQAHWLKDDPNKFEQRLQSLDRRYCRGLALRRAWRRTSNPSLKETRYAFDHR